MNPDEIARRVRMVVSQAFGVPAAALAAESGSHTIEAWDSMNHIHLIVALEGEFGISFEPERAVELATIGQLEREVAALVAQRR